MGIGKVPARVLPDLPSIAVSRLTTLRLTSVPYAVQGIRRIAARGATVVGETARRSSGNKLLPVVRLRDVPPVVVVTLVVVRDALTSQSGAVSGSSEPVLPTDANTVTAVLLGASDGAVSPVLATPTRAVGPTRSGVALGLGDGVIGPQIDGVLVPRPSLR